jgi:hypothetical protein
MCCWCNIKLTSILKSSIKRNWSGISSRQSSPIQTGRKSSRTVTYWLTTYSTTQSMETALRRTTAPAHCDDFTDLTQFVLFLYIAYVRMFYSRHSLYFLGIEWVMAASHNKHAKHEDNQSQNNRWPIPWSSSPQPSHNIDWAISEQQIIRFSDYKSPLHNRLEPPKILVSYITFTRTGDWSSKDEDNQSCRELWRSLLCQHHTDEHCHRLSTQ